VERAGRAVSRGAPSDRSLALPRSFRPRGRQPMSIVSRLSGFDVGDLETSDPQSVEVHAVGERSVGSGPRSRFGRDGRRRLCPRVD